MSMSQFGVDTLANAGVKAKHVPGSAPTSIFKPGDKSLARKEFGITDDIFLVTMVAANEADMDWLRAKVAMERRIGIESHLIGANELRDIAPYLAPRFLGAAFCPAEGQIDPLRGTAAQPLPYLGYAPGA